MKIIMFSHGHPKYTNGGAENVAYDLFYHFNNSEDIDCWFFMAGRFLEFEGGVDYKNFEYNSNNLIERQFIFNTPASGYDYFLHRHKHAFRFINSIIAIVRELKPDIIHFHHFLGFGLPVICAIKKEFPSIKIVLTLHDYLLICARDGKMLNESKNICTNPNLFTCSRCMHLNGESVYFLRECFFKNIISSVDAFVSPSKYLINVYDKWGICDNKMHFIKNGIKQIETISPDMKGECDKDRPVVFAYFGQLMDVKGIFVFLNAIKLVPDGHKAIFHINGDTTGLSESEKNDFFQTISSLKDKVLFMGPYKFEDMPTRMEGVDWVVCPSIWAENAPLVIQEAFLFKKPVICPSEGSFLEWVTDGFDGLYFRRNDHLDLLQKILYCSNNENLSRKFSSNTKTPNSVSKSAEEYLMLYNKLIGQSDTHNSNTCSEVVAKNWTAC